MRGAGSDSGIESVLDTSGTKMAKTIDSALKAKLVDALSEVADHKVLLDIVRAFKAEGGAQRIAYDTLEAIWKDYGFDQSDGSDKNSTRDELEYAMEIVWGFCAEGFGIWDGSLSQRRG
jgi:hypothetical protein